MRSNTKTRYKTAFNINKRQLVCSNTLVGCLLLLGTFPSLHAADDNYRSAEGHSHALDQYSAESTQISVTHAPVKLKSVQDTNSHLTAYPHQALWFDSNIWISNIGTLLYLDNDQDGYFSGFSLSIDVDTDYSYAEVFATIDIQHAERQRERLHTSGTFTVYGNSLTDEYRIDIELVNNYPIGDYDLFVTLVDAYGLTALDSVSAAELTNLSRLPLESEDLDNDPIYLTPVTSFQGQQTNSDIRVVEYAGAGGAWLLLVLGLLISVRIISHAALSSATGSINAKLIRNKSNTLKTYTYYIGRTFLQPFGQPRRILNDTTRSSEHHHWNKELKDDGQLPGSTPTLTG